MLVFGKICTPSSSSVAGIMTSLNSNMGTILENLDVVNQAITDIDTTRYLILATAGIALVIGMLWMVIMKMCAACITWTALILLVLSSCGLTYFLYDESNARQDEIDLITEVDAEIP